MKIAFIYRGDPRHRTANRLSMFQNIAAAKRLGNEVMLTIPREGMARDEAAREVKTALNDLGIDETVPVKCIPRPTLRRRGRRLFDVLAALAARAGKFDLVWSREFHAADYTTAFGLNTVIEHHHPFNLRQARIAKRMLRRPSFKGVVAISGVHKQMLLNEGWPEEKVIVAHSGVDLSLFAERHLVHSGLREKLAGAGQPLIVYAGSLYPGKGCDQILLAADRMRNAKFVCIGGRDHEVSEFKQRAATLSLANIEFTGRLPHALVSDYLRTSDILVAPFTKEARDIAGRIIIPFSSPLKLFEYMAAGKPIVASKIGAIPEVIRHEKNGLLVEPGNVAELVGAISRLLDDPVFAAGLGAVARKDSQSYSWEKRVGRVLDFAFARTLAERSRSDDEDRQQECLAPVWKLRRGD